MVDFHAHSIASDGSLSPSELVALGLKTGLSYLALTDHNTTRGLEEFLSSAQGTGLRAVAGIEVSCQFGDDELHILGLDLPRSSFSQMESAMEEVRSRAQRSKQELVENLRRAGYSIDYDAICKAHPHSVINRVHIGIALQEAGYIPSVNAGFQTFLSEEGGFYHPMKRLEAVEAIHLILELGAIPVWAHPFLKLDSRAVEQILRTLAPEGLVGMETQYSTFTEAQTRSAKALAQAFRLKESGGSDFHGLPKPDIQLGIGCGNLNIPDQVAVTLLNRSNK